MRYSFQLLADLVLPRGGDARDVEDFHARRVTVGFLTLALGLLASGCGSDAVEQASTAVSTAKGPALPTVVGAYETTLPPADVPANPPLELTAGSSTWKLRIASSGGAGASKRAFTIANAKLGELETSDFDVRGDHIVLHHEECSAGGTTRFHDNEYAFHVSGATLRFTKVRNSCPDRIAEVILTSEAWKKAG